MRVRSHACSLPLLLLTVACTGDSTSETSVDSQALKLKTPDYQKLYDEFEGRYDVDSFTGTIARTGGLAGAPVTADFYYPDGCAKKSGDEPEDNDKKWKHCDNGKGANELKGKTREDYYDAFPMVPLLQGGNVPRTQYSQFAAELASYGFIVVVPDLRQSFGPPGSPTMILTSQWVPNWVGTDLAQRDADPTSPLHGIIDTSNMGVTGHSFGAAAALASVQGTCQPPFCFGPPFAYRRPDSLKAAVVHGFQNCDPTSGQCFYPNTSAAPSMIVNGGLDDPGAPAQTAYQSLELPRSLVVLEGANHFGLTNDDLAGGINPEPNELEQSVSISRTARWTAAWLSTHLLGDEDATTLVTGAEDHVDGATVTTEL